MGPIHMVLVFLRALFRTQTGLAAENLALRQQLAVWLPKMSSAPRVWRDDGMAGAEWCLKQRPRINFTRLTS
jgi:hypothetical protein